MTSFRITRLATLARQAFGADAHVVDSDVFNGRVYVLGLNGATLFQHTSNSKGKTEREMIKMFEALLKARKVRK